MLEKIKGKMKKKKQKGIDRLEYLTLRPFAEKYIKFEEIMWKHLEARTDSEILRMEEALKKVNQKDWYPLYRMRESLLETIMEQKRRRGIG